jgi:hypothetical protein
VFSIDADRLRSARPVAGRLLAMLVLVAVALFFAMP